MNINARIVDECDIHAVVSEYTSLKRMGSEFRGPCPLHGGHGPNFSVNPDKGVYHCHTCKAGGNVITFVKEILSCDYRTAIKHLGDKFGINVEYDEPDDNKRLRELVEFLSSWWSHQLNGSPALDYLKNKGLPEEFAMSHGIGYFADTTQLLVKACRDHGFSQSLLYDAGIVKDYEGRLYSPLHGRLVVTIYDPAGRPVSFSGRSLTDKGPKWLNSPESPVYRRWNTLYGLNWAKENKDRAILVEGFFDVLSMRASGTLNCVASMGTSFTEGQASRMASYWDRASIFYDGDKSGLSASFKAADLMLANGITPKVCIPSEGIDPGCAITHPEHVSSALGSATDVVELKVSMLREKGYFESIEKKKEAILKLKPTVHACSDPVQKDLYASFVGDQVGVSRESILISSSPSRAFRKPSSDNKIKSLEEVALDFAASSEVYLERLIMMGVQERDFREPASKSRFNSLLGLLGGDFVPEELLHHEKEFDQAVPMLLKRVKARRISELQEKIAFSTDEEEKLELLSQMLQEKWA